MSYKVVRPLDSAGNWVAGTTPVIGEYPGWRIVRAPSGPAGPPSDTDFEFGWPGLVQAGEPPLPHTAPSAGTITAPTGSCDTAAAAPSVFVVEVDTGSGWQTAFTATFSPSTGTGPPSLSAIAVGSYPAGARFRATPPNPPDGSLYGATIVVR